MCIFKFSSSLNREKGDNILDDNDLHHHIYPEEIAKIERLDALKNCPPPSIPQLSLYSTKENPFRLTPPQDSVRCPSASKICYYGHDGQDRLIAGNSNNYMIGGRGNDVFDFTKVYSYLSPGKENVIYDFTCKDSEKDLLQIRLNHLVFPDLLSSDKNFKTDYENLCVILTTTFSDIKLYGISLDEAIHDCNINFIL